MEHIEEEVEDKKWYHSPIKWVLAIFLALIIIATVLPNTFVKLDPSPTIIPTIEEVFQGTSSQTNFSINSIQEFYQYVKVDGEIKKVADKITSISCKSNRICNAKALYLFTRDNINYVNDPVKFEFVKEPAYTLEVQSGDCDDHAVLLSSLLRSVGIQTKFVFIQGHVYIQAQLPEALNRYRQGDWVNLDPTCKDCEFGDIPSSLGEKTFI
mgnify:CR=1 FL=1